MQAFLLKAHQATEGLIVQEQLYVEIIALLVTSYSTVETFFICTCDYMKKGVFNNCFMVCL